MKVYELITALEQFPAGAEVVGFAPSMLYASVESVTSDGDVVIEIADAEIVDSEGDTQGLVSDAADLIRECTENK